MREDLSGPYPGYGLGLLESFHSYVVYRLLAPEELAAEIREMQELVARSYPSVDVDQDLGLGMMLWFTHFFPQEDWAVSNGSARWPPWRHVDRAARLFLPPSGPAGGEVRLHQLRGFPGPPGGGGQPQRVRRLNDFFRSYQSGDEYDREAITHVMACTSWFPGEFILKG